jgi:hypothetical protein
MWKLQVLGICLGAAVVLANPIVTAQTSGEKEEFSAAAIRNDNLGSGVERVIMRVTRWSTEAETEKLVQLLLKNDNQALLEALRELKPVGTIRTPDSLGYDLRYSHQEPAEDGGRRIVLATDRPIGYWEAVERPRTIDYPFTVIQMQVDKNGEGKGTMSYATKIIARGNTIELENFTTAPVMLSDIKAKKIEN